MYVNRAGLSEHISELVRTSIEEQRAELDESALTSAGHRAGGVRARARNPVAHGPTTVTPTPLTTPVVLVTAGAGAGVWVWVVGLRLWRSHGARSARPTATSCSCSSAAARHGGGATCSGGG